MQFKYLGIFKNNDLKDELKKFQYLCGSKKGNTSESS
jgi:hypothetical protein